MIDSPNIKISNMVAIISWIWTTFIVVVASALVHYLVEQFSCFSKKKKKLPPCPKGLPILGHLHLLGKNPHQDLHNLAKKHGPIMYLQLGFVPTIVVSSPEAAGQFLKTYDLVFAGRPRHEASRILAYGQSNITFGRYGPYWRNMRKLITLEILSQVKVKSFEAMRREQISLALSSLRDDSAQNGVNLSVKIGSLIADMICLMALGKKLNETDVDPRGFTPLIKEVMHVAVAPHLGDYFPSLGFLDFQRSIRRMKEIGKIIDGYLERVIEECCNQKDGSDTRKARSFVDTMLSLQESGNGDFQFERYQLKAVLLDLFQAAIDTSGTTIEWTLSELLRHPQVMKKLQKELEDVVGMNRMVLESDLDKLEYLDMVIKESLRLHPPAPLMIPHESLQDCTVDGFHIPKKSRIIVNVWAIGRDPEAWPEPEKFEPERFAGSIIDLRGQDFELIPFGSGRRSCPGMQLGLVTVRIVLSQLVHCFDWELPKGLEPSDVDVEEEFGLVMARANPLMAIPTYRLHT